MARRGRRQGTTEGLADEELDSGTPNGERVDSSSATAPSVEERTTDPAPNGARRAPESVGPPVGDVPMGPTGELTWRMQALLEETLLPSPKGSELRRTPTHDYLNRLHARTPHVAELFQENTKITPWSSVNTVLDADLCARTRSWYFASSHRPRPDDFDPEATLSHRVQVPVGHLEPPLGDLLSRLAREDLASSLLFGLDLWVLIGREVFRVIPRSEVLWLEKRLHDMELSVLRRSIVELPRDTVESAAAVLFLVPVPWRYMLFQGPRGYRRALFDVGRFLAWCERAVDGSFRPDIALDFFDHRVDAVLSLDGVERSTAAVVALNRVQGATT